MSERQTDADWQTLDARIAREVRGWVKWDELPTVNQQLVAIYNRRTWLRLDESGCPRSTDLLYKDWQPHKDVAQALKVKDEIVKRGWSFSLSKVPDFQTVGLFSKRATFCPGVAKTDAMAICLAIEQWLGAQRRTT